MKKNESTTIIAPANIPTLLSDASDCTKVGRAGTGAAELSGAGIPVGAEPDVGAGIGAAGIGAAGGGTAGGGTAGG